MLIILLIGAGLFFSIRTRFVQVRCFGEGMRKVFGNLTLRGGKQEHGIDVYKRQPQGRAPFPFPAP